MTSMFILKEEEWGKGTDRNSWAVGTFNVSWEYISAAPYPEDLVLLLGRLPQSILFFFFFLSSVAVPSESFFTFRGHIYKSSKNYCRILYFTFSYFTSWASLMCAPKFKCVKMCSLFLFLKENWKYEWKVLIFYYRWFCLLLKRIFIYFCSLHGCKQPEVISETDFLGYVDEVIIGLQSFWRLVN